MMAAAAPQDSTTPKDAVVRSDEPSPEAQATSRHAEFYFTDEMTVFQVENRLFRVHRHFLAENSLIFSSMFSLPREAEANSTPAEGTSDANPIHLSGVKELEFETLLRFFYKSIYDGFSLPLPSWIALLSIAHRYEFLNVRNRAIREIYDRYKKLQTELAVKQEGMLQTLMKLISVAEKYDVPTRFIVPLLATFVGRQEPLTEDEVLGFSALTVSRLAHAREDYQREQNRRFPPVDPKDIVCRIWQVQNDN